MKFGKNLPDEFSGYDNRMKGIYTIGRFRNDVKGAEAQKPYDDRFAP